MQVKATKGAEQGASIQVQEAALQDLINQEEGDKGPRTAGVEDDDLLAAAIEAADASIVSETVEERPVASQKKGKGKKTPQPAAKPAPEPKKPRVTYYANSKKDVLLDRIAGRNEALSLVDGDRETPEQAAETEKAIHEAVAKGMAKKVGQKAIMLFQYLAQGGELNEVIARTFKVLNRDGCLTTGDKGNLHLDLLSKPYSAGTARSQSNQMFTMLPSLKVVVKDGKGKFVPNPSSTIYQRFKTA